MPVYMIRAGGFGDVKIGVANDPIVRMKQLQTSMPVRLRIIRVLEGGLAEEKALHQRFAAHRVTGEWFKFSASLLGDVGLPDLPIPIGKRQRAIEDAEDEYRQLIADIMDVIGGNDVLAKALGIPPWEVRRAFWPTEGQRAAMIVLARQAGVQLTHTALENARDACRVIQDRRRDEHAEAERQKDNRDFEGMFIEKHGVAAVWWDRTTADPAEREASAA